MMIVQTTPMGRIAWKASAFPVLQIIFGGRMDNALNVSAMIGTQQQNYINTAVLNQWCL